MLPLFFACHVRVVEPSQTYPLVLLVHEPGELPMVWEINELTRFMVELQFGTVESVERERETPTVESVVEIYIYI